MNLKYIIATGAIILCCVVSTQTLAEKKAYNSAGIKVYNSSPPITKGVMEARDTRVPRAEAVKRTLRAAEQGDASAQFKMALRYDSGQGVPQDRAESVKWLRKAAEQGYVKAQYNLACMYDSGEGVSQDHTEAAEWFREAAEHGYASAQKNLGAKYGTGQGVPQSNVEAYVWSSIAATSGDEGAINNRDFAASRLSPEELASAQKRASELSNEIQQRLANK